MNNIATLVYKETKIQSGKPIISETTKDVFCEINSLSLSEQTRVESYELTGLIKCTINQANDNKSLSEVIINQVSYEITTKDRFKASDQVTLLLKERK